MTMHTGFSPTPWADSDVSLDDVSTPSPATLRGVQKVIDQQASQATPGSPVQRQLFVGQHPMPADATPPLSPKSDSGASSGESLEILALRANAHKLAASAAQAQLDLALAQEREDRHSGSSTRSRESRRARCAKVNADPIGDFSAMPADVGGVDNLCGFLPALDEQQAYVMQMHFDRQANGGAPSLKRRHETPESAVQSSFDTDASAALAAEMREDRLAEEEDLADEELLHLEKAMRVQFREEVSTQASSLNSRETELQRGLTWLREEEDSLVDLTYQESEALASESDALDRDAKEVATQQHVAQLQLDRQQRFLDERSHALDHEREELIMQQAQVKQKDKILSHSEDALDSRESFVKKRVQEYEINIADRAGYWAQLEQKKYDDMLQCLRRQFMEAESQLAQQGDVQMKRELAEWKTGVERHNREAEATLRNVRGSEQCEKLAFEEVRAQLIADRFKLDDIFAAIPKMSLANQELKSELAKARDVFEKDKAEKDILRQQVYEISKQYEAFQHQQLLQPHAQPVIVDAPTCTVTATVTKTDGKPDFVSLVAAAQEVQVIHRRIQEVCRHRLDLKVGNHQLLRVLRAKQ